MHHVCLYPPTHTQARAELQASEASLAAVNQTKDALYRSNAAHERTIDGLRDQLHEEVTGRKLAEQRSESLQEHLEQVRTKKVRG